MLPVPESLSFYTNNNILHKATKTQIFLQISKIFRFLHKKEIKINLCTIHPNAHLMNCRTLSASGAEPVITYLTFPPNKAWILPNTNLSHTLVFVMIPLKYTYIN